MDTPDTTRDKMMAAYALRCTSEQDLAVFKDYLDQYSRDLIATAVEDLLSYLGLGDTVEVEVLHLSEEQTRKLEQSGTLEDYLLTRSKDKDDCDG
jgi:hypothetical protein